MRISQLNHVALHVADVPTSSQFYREVLQLEAMPRPAFDFPGAWFRIGTDQELHLIGNRDKAVHSHHRGNHFALLVDDLDAWQQYLNARQVPNGPRKVRPDGAHQLYVQDPDGHWIELCTPAPTRA